MADRYLRATGNWNGAVWAATSGGTAGSAATPTASDNVYITANFTVTLSANAVAQSISHTNGRLNLSSYTLEVNQFYNGSVGAFQSYGSTARTIDMGSGTLIVHVPDANVFTLGGSNLTFNAGSSLLTINSADTGVANSSFQTLGKTFNDVIINLGTNGSSYGAILDITGSPTFNALIIQSKNSSAHTVNFDEEANVSFSRLVLIGSSSTNKLTVHSPNAIGPMWLNGVGYHTVYGQYVAMNGPYYDEGGSSARVGYIGSNSTDTESEWLIQDPPKLSTLSDALTTAPGSSTNFTKTGTVTTRTDGFGGGGYKFASGSTIISKGTYDIIGSKLVFERPIVAPGTTGDAYFGIGETFFPQINNIAFWAYTSYDPVTSTYKDQLNTSRYAVGGNNANAFYYPITAPKFIRFEVQATGYFTLGYSADAVTWATVSDGFLSGAELLLMRSARLHGEFNTDSYIGSIGMLPAVVAKSNFLPFFI